MANIPEVQNQSEGAKNDAEMAYRQIARTKSVEKNSEAK